MRRAFQIYQYLAPALLTPLAVWLWGGHYEGNLALATIAVGVPVAHAYLVPAIGTNVLRVWEFDTRLRLGRFRPHHGFVFGSATALLMVFTIGEPTARPTIADVMQAAILSAVMLGAINWLYDAGAIRAGILKVYNQPWADRRGAGSIAADYALWFFGGFGLIHGAGLKLAEGALLTDPNPLRALAIGCALLGATATLPTLGYIAQSYWRHGHHGCLPIMRQAGE